MWRCRSRNDRNVYRKVISQAAVFSNMSKSVEIRKELKIAISTLRLTFRTLCEYPRILTPLFIAALVKAFFLVLFYYAPMPPLVNVFGPLIKNFFGEAYLHYPVNFMLVARLFYYSQSFIWLTLDICMWGTTSNMINQLHEGRSLPSIVGSFNRVVRRYPQLFLVSLLILFLSLVSFRVPHFLMVNFYFLPREKFFFLQFFFFVSFLAAILIEAVLIYTIPTVVIERKSFVAALKRTIALSKEIFLPTFIIVLLPRLFDLIAAFLRQNLPILITRTLPEITLVVLAATIAIAFITDLIIVSVITNLFLTKSASHFPSQQQR